MKETKVLFTVLRGFLVKLRGLEMVEEFPHQIGMNNYFDNFF